MAFYKKKIEKLAAESAAGFLKELQEIEQDATKALAITDPAERYIACADVGKSLGDLEEKIVDHKYRAGSTATGLLAHAAGWGTAGVVAGAGIAAAVFIFPPLFVFAGFGIAGLQSAISVREKLEERNRAILEGSVETLRESISALEKVVAEERKNILKNKLPEVAESEHFADMHARFHDVREAFAVAVARETMSEQRNKISALKKTIVKK